MTPGDDDLTDPGIRIGENTGAFSGSFAEQVAAEAAGVTLPTRARPGATSAAAAVQAQAAASAPEAGSPVALAPGARLPDLGPLQPLLSDAGITEIMVNDLRNVFVEKDGKIYSTPVRFVSLEDLGRVIRNITDVTGRVLSPETPMIDVVLADGSRVNIVGPPLTVTGPSITIRRFPRRLGYKNLLEKGAFDARLAQFLSLAVGARLNILISGGTGSGKTTLLNALASFIPPSERVVVIEETPEVIVSHPNHVRMQSKASTGTSPAITQRELMANALRMRPDRVIIGECRRGEIMELLQAMNTGHSGSMSTIHANSPRDALYRIETLCQLYGGEIPPQALRRQIASTLDLIVQVSRFRDGSRRISLVSEISGLEGEMITLQDIFRYEEGKGFGTTGLIPKCVQTLRAHGAKISNDFFT